jgi:hypothetical protein
MNRLGPGRARCVDDPIRSQIALARGRRTDEDGFISLAHVRGARVRFAVHGNRAHTELVTGANDPDGDLAAVGYQDFAEHFCVVPC